MDVRKVDRRPSRKGSPLWVPRRTFAIPGKRSKCPQVQECGRSGFQPPRRTPRGSAVEEGTRDGLGTARAREAEAEPEGGTDHCSPVILIVIEHEGMRSCCSRASRGGGSSGGIRSGEEAAKTAEMTAGDL